VVWCQNHWDSFPGLASESVAMLSPDLASKLVAKGILVWASKPVPTVW
jgi:hypothetical protein